MNLRYRKEPLYEKGTKVSNVDLGAQIIITQDYSKIKLSTTPIVHSRTSQHFSIYKSLNKRITLREYENRMTFRFLERKRGEELKRQREKKNE